MYIYIINMHPAKTWGVLRFNEPGPRWARCLFCKKTIHLNPTLPYHYELYVNIAIEHHHL